MIIEKATNSNVALELRNRFFDPLGLENTFMSIEEPLDGELANGHILGIDGARYPRGALDSMGWTAAGIFSTAEDLARWAQVLFEGSVLSEDYLGQMLDFANTGEDIWNLERVCLGIWAYEHPQLGEIWYHDGQWPFYHSLMGYLPDHDMVFVVLMNEYIVDLFTVMNILLEASVN